MARIVDAAALCAALAAAAACGPARSPAADHPPAAARLDPPDHPDPIPLDEARGRLAEADERCRADGGALWGRSLCAPLMFVDRATRFVVANRAAGPLQPRSGVYVGTLPADQGVANTSFTWAGERWVQVVWPLPADPDERAALVMHEHFHRIQGELGFAPAAAGDNAHLDELDGRYLLQLEWRALAAALRAPDEAQRTAAIADALAFRVERGLRYPGAATREDALELNEGLAEYTGVVTGPRTPEARTAAALRDLAAHTGDPSFVRSFAYATGPAYGLLLDRRVPGWRQRVARSGSLAGLLAGAVLPSMRAPQQLAAAYGGTALLAAETERAARRAAELARYRQALVDGPVLIAPLSPRMTYQFNPSSVLPLGELGAVYPAIRVVDDWGILDVTGGALLRPDRSAVIVAAPAAPTARSLDGRWTLDLAAGWTLVPAPAPGPAPDRRPGDLRLAREAR